MTDDTKMSEAEVSLELALYLIRSGKITSDVTVALDGAQVKIGDIVVFDIKDYFRRNKCRVIKPGTDWRGVYEVVDSDYRLIVHSNPGQGDVIALLDSGRTLKVESKKGPLISKKGSQEYPLLREAIGQLMTIEEYNDNEILAVAVPYSNKFYELTSRWKNAPLIKKIGLHFLLIKREKIVVGIDDILFQK